MWPPCDKCGSDGWPADFREPNYIWYFHSAWITREGERKLLEWRDIKETPEFSTHVESTYGGNFCLDCLNEKLLQEDRRPVSEETTLKTLEWRHTVGAYNYRKPEVEV